jgi:hypothetical protein
MIPPMAPDINYISNLLPLIQVAITVTWRPKDVIFDSVQIVD